MAPKAITDGMIVEGSFVADPEIERLRVEVRRLGRELDDARREALRAREDADRALTMLRHQLGPLYRALQAVFGELDAAGIADAPVNLPGNNRVHSHWDEWKSRLGPNCAKVIDALLLGGKMNVKAIMTTAKLGRDSVYQATSKMGQAGIVVKDGSEFSLKKL